MIYPGLLLSVRLRLRNIGGAEESRYDKCGIERI